MAHPAAAAAVLGPFVRLHALAASQLPPHPELASVQESSKTAPVDLAAFVKAALDEGAAFVDGVLPQTFKEGAEKASPPAAAKVRLLSRTIAASELPDNVQSNGSGETWFARRSRHRNERAVGTADIQEFDNGLRKQHSVHEMDYTPNVFDAHKVLDWDEQLRQVGSPSPYEEAEMCVYEMCHKMPPPLNNRCFATLVISAKTPSPQGFLLVQIPVDIAKVPASLYSSGRNTTEGADALKKQKVVVGQYVSVERARLLPEEGGSLGTVEWEMATASDAKGVLPMPLQKMGVPGAIVKDVGFFIGWNDRRRGK